MQWFQRSDKNSNLPISQLVNVTLNLNLPPTIRFQFNLSRMASYTDIRLSPPEEGDDGK